MFDFLLHFKALIPFCYMPVVTFIVFYTSRFIYKLFLYGVSIQIDDEEEKYPNHYRTTKKDPDYYKTSLDKQVDSLIKKYDAIEEERKEKEEKERKRKEEELWKPRKIY